ncbi:MAG: hypothetical protein M3Z03_16785 [Actinomycetota bacterium]|nr:hypothetical protein [Actinomycetota bacterium]
MAALFSRLGAAVVLVAGLIGGCSTAREDTARSDQERLLRSVLEQGSEDANSLEFDDDAAACAAAAIVDDLGEGRLRELGLDVASRRGPELTSPPLSEAEGDAVFGAFEGCLDLVGQLGRAFARDGELRTSVAECVASRYVDSGVLRDALLAPGSDPELNDRIDRTVLDAIAACDAS